MPTAAHKPPDIAPSVTQAQRAALWHGPQAGGRLCDQSVPLQRGTPILREFRKDERAVLASLSFQCLRCLMLLLELPQDGETFAAQSWDRAEVTDFTSLCNLCWTEADNRTRHLFLLLWPLGTALFCFNFVSTGCLLLSLNHHLSHALLSITISPTVRWWAVQFIGKKNQHKIIYIFQRDQLSRCLVWRSESSWVIVVNTVVFVIRLIGYLKHKENKKNHSFFFFQLSFVRIIISQEERRNNNINIKCKKQSKFNVMSDKENEIICIV